MKTLLSRKFLLTYFCFIYSGMNQIQGQSPLAYLGGACYIEHNYRPSGAKIFFPSNVQFSYEIFHDLEVAKLLSQYVQIPSPSGQESAAGKWYLDQCRNRGLVTRELIAPDGTYNSVASIFPLESGKPNYIFINHIDVVAPGDPIEWRYDPYSGKIAEGFVWGRGAYDNKGVAIMQLMAMSSLAEKAMQEDWPVNFSILSLSGEEVFASGGAQYVAEHFIADMNPAAFFGEGPAGVQGISKKSPDQKIFSIAVSQKRAIWLKLSMEYESSGHGSTPPATYPSKELVHALNHLLSKKQKIRFNEHNTSLLHLLGDLEGGLNGFFLKNIHLLSPLAKKKIRKDALYSAFFTNTISLTHFESPLSDRNSIPNKASAVLDCRLMPGQSTESFLKYVRKNLKNERIQIEIIKETPDAVPSNPELPVFQSIISAIQITYPDAKVLPIMLQATVDSNFFRAKGYQSYCFVPILMSPDLLRSVHSKNEKVPISSLDNGVKITVDFIENISKKYR